MDSALITVTQGDFLYLDEWIQYHYNIGFKLICIVYNGDYKDVDRLPKYDYVKYFDFGTNDDNKLFSRFDGRTYKFGWPHIWQYSVNMVFNYIKSFFMDYIKYIAIIDTDEFISPTEKFDNITNYLNTIYNQTISSEYIHMQFYNGNGKIFYEDKPVLERFTTPVHEIVLEKGKNSGFKKSIINLQHPDINNMVIGCFHDTNYSNSNNNLDFNKIVLKHFFCKSLEEWIMKMNPKNDKDYFNRYKGHIFSGSWSEYFGPFLKNKITDDAIKAIPYLLKKHQIDYKPEIEEENEEFKNLYKKINNIE